jgi:hypothetical protein
MVLTITWIQIQSRIACVFWTSCINNATNSDAISGQSNQHLTTTMEQNSICVRNSNCQNNGSTDQNHLTNQQSALCANTSDCNNSGNNDKTTCSNGSTCDKSGRGTTVLANHADCSCGPDGTPKLCQGGRSIIIGGSSGGIVGSTSSSTIVPSNSGNHNNATSN